MYKLILVSLFVCQLLICGCSPGLDTAKEMREPCFSQEYIYEVQPMRVWGVLNDFIESRDKGRVLVEDSDSMILSWVEKLDSYPDRALLKKISENPQDLEVIRSYETYEVGQGGIAISTVSLRPFNDKTIMRVRRVYYGQYTQPDMAHSRGDFANLLNQEVVEKL